ncbi:hypothetical protein C0Q44_20750 [Paenibacillus sp. PCH8]|uniref:hypothetical protein n=1 Tax=Paenibacillus sp. PCH8 TaxID=2066524 RepID=UPI000CF8DBAE|nr:hypothetical protein [Paenibacillus sp. PCH8]PQP82084.1 hypothetical protein C0Q44_20750 [Paenibacillus sp. PCH8]
MDIITYGKVVKLSNEIKEAREGNGTLDARLDKIALGMITTVNEKKDLPSHEIPDAIYVVIEDESNQSLPTLYIYAEEEYTRIAGSDVAYKSNGILTINGIDIVVYEHPDTHSADMISDGETHVSMTWAERKRLNVIDPWESISDLVEYTDVVTYFAYDERGRVTRQVVTDNYTEQLVREPVLTMPASTDGYAPDESFLVISIGEIYRFDGLDFVQLPTMVEAIYNYDNEGRIIAKSITRMGATPVQTNFSYIYNSLGNRIAIKKY